MVQHMPNLSPTIAGDCILKPALFLEDTDQVCITQMTLDLDGCTAQNFFDSSNFYSPILRLLGTASSVTSGDLEITLASEHYKIDNAGAVTTIADTDIVAPTFTAGATCQCENFIRQVHYTITYQALDDNQFYPQSAEVQFVLSDIDDTCDDVFDIGQKFVYRYVLSGGEDPVYNSGNPGYIDDYPLILGLKNGDVVT